MLQRAFEAGMTLAWVTGDSVYGDDRALRGWLEERTQAYVLAVSGKESVWLTDQQQQIKTILAELSSEGWEQLNAGVGSKGPRLYDWRHLELSAPAQQGWASAFLSVIREEEGAEAAPKKGPPNQPARSSLAAFKASRGLQSG
jgi:SRSO17 transposase